MRRTSALLLALIVVLTGLVRPAPARAAGAGPVGATVRVGGVPVARCGLVAGRPSWCGSVAVPLDPTDAGAPTIRIGFGWVPASGRPVGTLLAQEGGPGYPATGTAPDFARMFGPLLATHDLLVVDARGTGRSTPVDCEPLQSLPSPSGRLPAAVAACGEQLDHTWRRADGSWVHASDLFTTADTARDTAAVLRALRAGPVDLYGDSYGTYFAQSFLARYPGMLRSVVLDSAYEARDLDPWYRTTVTTAHTAFDAVCARAAGCPPGSSWSRIGRLAALLRAHPAHGRVVGTDARPHVETVDVTALVNLVNDAGYDTDPYRQLDAAARAYLGHRDALPLLRLYAQDVGYDYSDYVGRARAYSDGLFFAVSCTDYPQLFDPRAAPAQRRVQLAAAERALPARTFAPFTTAEWIGMLPYTEAYTACLDWPAPTHRRDPPVPPGPLDPGHVPVLVLNGELDSLTPAAGGAHVARQIGPDARAVVAANTVHLVALDSASPCGRGLVRAFVTDPRAGLDTACTATIPAIRAVPAFPATLAATTPADGPGPASARRIAALAVAAAGDARARWRYVDGRHDLGIRGGRVDYGRDGGATLTDARWVSDATVSGAVARTADGGHGLLQVRSAGRATDVTVRWGSGPLATAWVGTARFTLPAP